MPVRQRTTVTQASGPVQEQVVNQQIVAQSSMWNSIGASIGKASATYVQAVNSDEMAQAQVYAKDQIQKYKIALDAEKAKAYETGTENHLEGGALSLDEGLSPAGMVTNQKTSFTDFSKNLKSEILGSLSFAGGKQNMNLWLDETFNTTGNEMTALAVTESIGLMNARSAQRTNDLMGLGEWGSARDEVRRAEESGVISHVEAMNRNNLINTGEATTVATTAGNVAFDSALSEYTGEDRLLMWDDGVNAMMKAIDDEQNMYLTPGIREAVKSNLASSLKERYNAEDKKITLQSSVLKEDLYNLIDSEYRRKNYGQAQNLALVKSNKDNLLTKDYIWLLKELERKAPEGEPVDILDRIPLHDQMMLFDTDVPDEYRYTHLESLSYTRDERKAIKDIMERDYQAIDDAKDAYNQTKKFLDDVIYDKDVDAETKENYKDLRASLTRTFAKRLHSGIDMTREDVVDILTAHLYAPGDEEMEKAFEANITTGHTSQKLVQDWSVANSDAAQGLAFLIETKVLGLVETEWALDQRERVKNQYKNDVESRYPNHTVTKVTHEENTGIPILHVTSDSGSFVLRPDIDPENPTRWHYVKGTNEADLEPYILPTITQLQESSAISEWQEATRELSPMSAEIPEVEGGIPAETTKKMNDFIYSFGDDLTRRKAGVTNAKINEYISDNPDIDPDLIQLYFQQVGIGEAIKLYHNAGYFNGPVTEMRMVNVMKRFGVEKDIATKFRIQISLGVLKYGEYNYTY